MSNLDFNNAVKQEERYLRKIHPTTEDIPGCMRLFDDFLLCNGAHNAHLRSQTILRLKYLLSDQFTGQVSVSIWSDG